MAPSELSSTLKRVRRWKVVAGLTLLVPIGAVATWFILNRTREIAERQEIDLATLPTWASILIERPSIALLPVLLLLLGIAGMCTRSRLLALMGAVFAMVGAGAAVVACLVPFLLVLGRLYEYRPL